MKILEIIFLWFTAGLKFSRNIRKIVKKKKRGERKINGYINPIK